MSKEYLQQAFRLNAKIDADLLELEQLKVLATSLQSMNLSQGRVTGGSDSDKIGSTISKIVDLEILINDEIDRFVDLKREIKEKINAVPNDNFKLILQKRYLNFQKWEQIAIDMNYTFQWVHVLHRKALNSFAKFLIT